jgi:aconitate decarboxylase
MPQTAQQLARFAGDLRATDIPEETIARAKLIVLDALGCGLHGAAHPSIVSLAAAIGTDGQGRGALAWSTKSFLALPSAVLLDAAAVHADELDDYHSFARLHAGCSIVPALLALAQQERRSGGEFITALTAGIEVAARVGDCLRHWPQEAGFHVPNLTGCIAAATASGVMLRLDQIRLEQCIALACLSATGLGAGGGWGHGKALAAGWAAQSGVRAALLARGGVCIGRDALGGKGGLLASFSQAAPKLDPSALTKDLGSRFHTDHVLFKAYACRGPIHTALDAVRSAGIRSVDEVVSVRISMAEKAYCDVVGRPYEPTSVEAAQSSMAFCIAALLIEGEVFTDQFTSEKIRAPRLLELARRVAVGHDPSLRNLPGATQHTVVVTWRSAAGEEREIRVDVPAAAKTIGNASDLVRRKFVRLGGAALSAAAADAILSAVDSLDRLDDVSAALDPARRDGAAQDREFALR